MAKKVTIKAKHSTVIRIILNKCRSLRFLNTPFRIFSENVTEGANKVALAQLLIAESNAPKNIT